MRLRGLISALALLSACGGLPEEAEPLGPRAECVVEGEADTGRIDVAAEGVRPFSVALNAPAWVRLTLASGPPAVAVRGPHLEFAGAGESFPVHTYGPLVTMGGLVRLGSAMNVASAEVVGEQVLAAFEPRFQPRLSGVPVSCAWLAPGEAEEAVEPSEAPPADESLTTPGRPCGLPLSIHLSPDDARAVQLDAPQPEFLWLSMGERSGGWRRVRWHDDAITVDGWVRDGDVRETDLIGGMDGLQHRLLPGPGAGTDRDLDPVGRDDHLRGARARRLGARSHADRGAGGARAGRSLRPGGGHSGCGDRLRAG